jgi:hypothetical protein
MTVFDDLKHRLPVLGDDITCSLRSPPKPRMTLRIGVVGHRPNRLKNNADAELQQVIERTLRVMEQGVAALAAEPDVARVYQDVLPEIRVVTGIAYGVDQIAMTATLALRDGEGRQSGDTSTASLKASWRLELVSPAPLEVAAVHAWADRSDQSGDMPAQLKSYLERWEWVRGSADAVAELPIVWARNPSASEAFFPPELLSSLFTAQADREAASWGWQHGYMLSYAPAAEFLLRNIDVLLAFWDGGPSAGAGGTVDIIERAHAAGMPVVMVRLDRSDIAPRRLLAFERDDLGREMAGRDRPIGHIELSAQSIFDEGLVATLKPLFVPPDAGDDAAHSHDGQDNAHPDQHDQHDGHAHDHHLSLEAFLNEQLTAFESSRTYDCFLDFWLGKRRQAFSSMFEGLFQRLVCLPLLVSSARQNPSRAQVDASYRLNARSADAKYHWSEQEWVTLLSGVPIAGEHGRKIKSVLHSRFIVADLLAVDYANRYRSSVILSYLLSTVAVTLAIIGIAFAGDSKILKACLLAIEFGIIIWIMVMVSASRKDRHHSKLVYYRALAESLRHMLFLASVGEYPAADKHQAANRNWVSWYVQVTARELGLPTSKYDQACLKQTLENVSRCEVLPQIGYHKRTSHKLFHVNHELHAFGDALFTATLVSVILSLGLIAGYFLFPSPGWSMGLKFTGSAAAVLPAVGAALTGIRYALDLETKAERHEEMARQLEDINAAILQAAAKGRWDETRRMLNDLEDILIRDVGQFQSSYARRALTVPA